MLDLVVFKGLSHNSQGAHFHPLWLDHNRPSRAVLKGSVSTQVESFETNTQLFKFRPTYQSQVSRRGH